MLLFAFFCVCSRHVSWWCGILAEPDDASPLLMEDLVHESQEVYLVLAATWGTLNHKLECRARDVQAFAATSAARLGLIFAVVVYAIRASTGLINSR